MARVFKSGNGYAIMIPKDVREKLKIKEKDDLTLVVQDQTILMKKFSIEDFSKPQKKTFNNLLSAECKSA